MTTPTNEEQLILQLLNRARSDPQAEMDAMFNTGQRNIDGAISYFGTKESTAKGQVANKPAVAPLAWDPGLGRSADTHNNLMVNFDQQSHNLPGEPGLLQRMTNGGFNFDRGGAAAENVFAYTQDPLHGHAGFYIDWGFGPNGIQSPAGHRNAMLSSTYTKVGIGYRSVPSNKDVGPYALTQHFAVSYGDNDPMLVGVAINDRDNDDFYDIGEGLSGITVTAVGGGETHSTRTWSSGGYALELDANTTYTVTFSGSGLGGTQTYNVRMGSQNVALDVERGTQTSTQPPPDQPSTPSTPATPTPTPTGRADNVRGTSADERFSTGGGNDTIRAGRGDDTVYGGDGNDFIKGESGDDYLRGDDGNDKIYGQYGDDTMFGGNGDDMMRGSSGRDRMIGGRDDDNMRGGSDNDYVDGGSGDDFVFGEAGDDTVLGGSGNDRIYDGTGNDVMTGSWGRDVFYVYHYGADSHRDVDVITDLNLKFDDLFIRSFAGNRHTRVDSIEELSSLSLKGLSVTQTGDDVTMVFRDGSYFHTLILQDIDLI